ncbi:MAG: hypothetical protein DDT20_00852 [Firmicutes bacterium]|nr:hypothetical protein [Bacillota bacterium]
MNDDSDRQTARLADVPELYRKAHERLAVELALAGPMREEPEAVFARYGYTPDQAIALLESRVFLVLLERVGAEVREQGLSFRAKARAISEDLLPHAYEIATDPQQSAAVRADLIKWSAKVAGHEPKEKDEVKGGGFNLSITFAGQAPMKVVSSDAALIEQQ